MDHDHNLPGSARGARAGLWLAALLLRAGLAGLPCAAHAENGGLRDFCAERPGKATPACVVDKGHVLAEIDLFDVARSSDGGVTSRTTLVFSPHLRLGLTDRIEAGITLAPFTETRTSGDPSARPVVRGTGDTVIDLKFSLRNPDGSAPSVALMPFVTVPTAQHGLGAGGFQGGVIAPVALALPSGFSLGLDPEIDLNRDGAGSVRPAYVIAAALGHALAPGLSGGVELWANWSHAPQGWQREASADASLAWIPRTHPNLQLDAGVNLGLTHETPGVQGYIGISHRF